MTDPVSKTTAEQAGQRLLAMMFDGARASRKKAGLSAEKFNLTERKMLYYNAMSNGMPRSDAEALWSGARASVRRVAHQGVGETMWIGYAEVRVVSRQTLQTDNGELASMQVELVGEPNVQSRMNPYQPGRPEWGPARPQDVDEVRRKLTETVGFLLA